MNEFAGSLQILVYISRNYKKLIFCFSRSLAMRAIIIFGYPIGLFDSILNFSGKFCSSVSNNTDYYKQDGKSKVGAISKAHKAQSFQNC